MEKKIKIAIMSEPMDRRPERSFFAKRLVENLLENPELEIYLIHYKKMSDEPLYQKAHEIIIPLLSLPFGSHFFSFIWFCFKTKEKFDIVHWLLPRVFPFFWLFPAKKVVVTAHDGYVGVWTKANIVFWFVLSFLNRYIDAVIGVSEDAKKDIISNYHIPESKTYVAYNGVDTIYRPIPESSALEVLKKYNVLADRYFIYVGGMQPHKNVKGLVDAYILLRETIPVEEKLVIVGKTSFGEEVLEKIKQTKYSKDIICAGFVQVDDLPAFYSKATSLVFVSLNEGCGIPLIEAMACGTSVITSNISAMPEIVGEAALLVDPYSTEDIMLAMKRIIEDRPLREQLVNKGLERAKVFTWEGYTQQTTEVYKKIINNK